MHLDKCGHIPNTRNPFPISLYFRWVDISLDLAEQCFLDGYGSKISTSERCESSSLLPTEAETDLEELAHPKLE